MCDDHKICSPDTITIASSVERDKNRFDLDVAHFRNMARRRICGSIWYDDQKTRSLGSEDFFGGTTSNPKAAEIVAEEFRQEGWQCKVVYIILGAYSIEFYNPKMKPSWWWRTF